MAHVLRSVGLQAALRNARHKRVARVKAAQSAAPALLTTLSLRYAGAGSSTYNSALANGEFSPNNNPFSLSTKYAISTKDRTGKDLTASLDDMLAKHAAGKTVTLTFTNTTEAASLVIRITGKDAASNANVYRLTMTHVSVSGSFNFHDNFTTVIVYT